MCGRYTLTTPVDHLLEIFDVPRIDFEYGPRYNIAPTQDAPVVARDGKGRKMGLLRWGLVPSWADDSSIGNRLVNARSETAAGKPAFRRAFRRRRCLVPADGFFEWTKEGGEKVPHWIHRKDREPLAMAGLWERWQPEEGEPLFTYTILTRDATKPLRWLHSRMPVLLDAEARRIWLDPEREPDELRRALQRARPGELEHHPVSTAVNSPRNDTPECIRPLERR